MKELANLPNSASLKGPVGMLPPGRGEASNEGVTASQRWRRTGVGTEQQP